jgi:UDP-N-acetylglucosamine 1-carboxyvinyltransferase
VLCAALADGQSELTNAACEPHVQEFCEFMRRMGAKIEGTGTSRLTVDGVGELHGVDFTFVEDFHEVVTFLALGAITGGNVEVRNSAPQFFPLLDRSFAKLGVEVTHEGGWSRARVPAGLRVREPFTRNMLQVIGSEATARIVELEMFWNKVYDGALGWTSELSKFGAHAFQSDPHRVITFGGKPLVGAEVDSPYIIRVAIALLMLAASIEGKSTIYNATPIRRAHPRFVENLVSLGAKIEWTGADA